MDMLRVDYLKCIHENVRLVLSPQDTVVVPVEPGASFQFINRHSDSSLDMFDKNHSVGADAGCP